jgi:hypothetical protein
MDGRDCNRGGLDFAVRGEKLLERTERAASEFAGGGISAQQVGIDHADQADGLACLFQLLVDAGVIASERACADYGDIDDAVGIQGRFSGGSGRRRHDCN